MFRFLKYIIQLILSPAKGWDDVENANPLPERLFLSGMVPLLLVAALTEFVPLFADGGISLGTAIIRAIVDFGTYFVSVFIARLIFEVYLGKVCEGRPDTRRGYTTAVLALGMMVLIRIVDNLCPWDLIFMRLLPIYVVLVLYKSCGYMKVQADSEMRYLAMASLTTVVVPLAIYYLFYLLLP